MWPARRPRYCATPFTAIASRGCGSALLGVDHWSPQLGSRDCLFDLTVPISQAQGRAAAHPSAAAWNGPVRRSSALTATVVVWPSLLHRHFSLFFFAACHHAPSPTRPLCVVSFIHDGAGRAFDGGLCRRAPYRPHDRPHSPRPPHAAATRAAFPLPSPLPPSQATCRASGHPRDMHVCFFPAAHCSGNGGRGGAVADGRLLWPRPHHSSPHVCGPL